MTGIAAGGGLAARGSSAQGMGIGAKGHAVGGGAQHGQQPAALGGDFGRDGALSRGQGFSQRDAFSPAKQAHKPRQTGGAHQTQQAHKPHQAAGAHQAHQVHQSHQAQKPHPTHQAHAQGAKPPDQATLHTQQAQQPQQQRNTSQEQQKPQVQQAEAMKAVQQAAQRQLDLQHAALADQMQRYRLEEQQTLLQVLMDMRKKFLEWVKQLFELMAQPATH